MIRKTKIFLIVFMSVSLISETQTGEALKWHKYELVFTSSIIYENPVQGVRTFEVTFTSPTGIKKTINLPYSCRRHTVFLTCLHCMERCFEINRYRMGSVSQA